MSIALAVLVLVVGLVLFLVCAGKAQQIGLAMFTAGLIAALIRFAGEASLRIG